MVKLVMLIGGGLVWTVLISAVFGHAPWNRTFGPSDGGKEQIWEHRNRNFSQYRPGAGSYQKDQHNHHHGPWSWNEYRPHHRPSPFNLEENTTVVWPNLDQGSETTTSKFVPLINMRPVLGSSSISQSSPVLILASEQATTTTRRPNLTQEVSLQAVTLLLAALPDRRRQPQSHRFSTTVTTITIGPRWGWRLMKQSKIGCPGQNL
ncbi:hypothetical protein pipiens_004954 [Culex pipiens pipiens]|uniref:Uncharacterized protein n=1 Tax=Culex pipiens pipiens TaxID=38569 RepID=A0ABD1CD60_CULPP